MGSNRFSSLIDKRKEASKALNIEVFKMIYIDDIVPDPEQPRKHFDEKDIEELAVSIKARGVLQPIRVTIGDDGKYVLVAGERRWRAARIAEVYEIPSYIGDDSKSDRLINGLVENIQRAGLSAIEKANAILEIQKLNPQLYDNDLAKKIGISREMLYRLLNIHKLPAEMLPIFYSKRLTDRHAKALLMLDNYKELQNELFDNICNSDISGTEAIKTAKAWLKEMPQRKTPFTKIYINFKERFLRLDKKISTLDSNQKALIKEQIDEVKKLLLSLEDKLIDKKRIE